MNGPRSPWPDDTVRRIVDRLAAAPTRAGRTKVLAIDGRSGSGKSTLARAVRAALDPSPPLVAVEDLYPGWDGLSDGVARLHEWVLAPLAAGRPARYRRYDWARGEYRAGPVDVPESEVLIVEGVGAGSRSGRPYLSLVVYLEAPEPVRFARAMARDGDTYRPHWRRWADQEQRLLAGDDDPRAAADLIIRTQEPGLS